MKTNMKQYKQEDINQISSIKEEAPVVKDPSKLELPQDEPKEKIELTHEQLHDSLLFAQDMLERSQIPFVVLGELARSMRDYEVPMLDSDMVHIGVMVRYYNPDTRSMLNTLLDNAHVQNLYMDENIVTFEHNGVPVQIDIVKNHYLFFEYPDVRFYRLTEFRLPNPFEEYWKWKDQVK